MNLIIPPIALFLFGAIFFSVLDKQILSIASPMWRLGDGVSEWFSLRTSVFRSKVSLEEENRGLKQELESYRLRLISSGMSHSEDSPRDGIKGVVIARPPQTPYDVLIADLPSSGEVRLGAKVYVPEGPVIGEVFETSSSQVKIRLFSSAGVETSGYLERGPLALTLLGRGAGNFRIMLPREALVETGDRIMDASLSGDIVAVVNEITLEPTDPLKEVLASTPVNIFNLRFVIIER